MPVVKHGAVAKVCSKLKSVQLGLSANHDAAPFAPNVKACRPVHGIAQKTELNGARRRTIGLQEATPCHHKGTRIGVVRDITHRAKSCDVVHFGASLAFHA